MVNVINFTASDDGDDDDTSFQEMLNNLSGLAPVTPGKRGRGRKPTNNIGADVLGLPTLKELRSQYHVDLSKPGNLKGNTLWGVIDQKSYDRASQISRGMDPSYSQVGILAVSLALSNENTAFLQWWKGTIVEGVLTFKKADFKGANYILGKDAQGMYGLWRIDSTTGTPFTKKDGSYFSFPLHTLVNFEAYLDAVVSVTEVSVAFPEKDIPKLRGLAEILVNVNMTSEDTSEVLTEDTSSDVEDFEEEDYEEEE